MKTIRGHAAALLAVVLLTGCALADAPVLRFTRLWTYNHAATPGQIGEIPAFDHKTNTLWVAGIAGVDVLDADKGALIKHIDTRTFGTINSVAINDGRAAFAIEAATRTAPGVVVFYDTETRELAAGINQVTVGAGPDMLTFTHDGKKLLVANEATPCTGALPASCRYGARIGTTVPRVFASPADDPAGSVSIIDMATRSVIATAGFAGVPLVGEHVRLNTGMDYEPEYIAVAQDGKTAFVTLQEANAIGVLDLTTNAFTKIIGLGVKDFSVPGNEIDPLNDGIVTFGLHPVKGIYMPDSIATYEWRGDTYLVMANEGDFREDVVIAQLRALVGKRPVDVVISDMAPNLSGIESSDAARMEHLVELAVEFAQNHLAPGGALVAKVFHGSGHSQLTDLFKKTFRVVKPIKPKASRDRSAETFLVGVGLKSPGVAVDTRL